MVYADHVVDKRPDVPLRAGCWSRHIVLLGAPNHFAGSVEGSLAHRDTIHGFFLLAVCDKLGQAWPVNGVAGPEPLRLSTSPRVRCAHVKCGGHRLLPTSRKETVDGPELRLDQGSGWRGESSRPTRGLGIQAGAYTQP